jgi:hypothetical protein
MFRFAVNDAKEKARKMDMENITSSGIWRALNSIRNKDFMESIPTISHGTAMAVTTDAKLDMFGELYFPGRSSDSPFIMAAHSDNSALTPITMQELQGALAETEPLSAPGHDDIPAIALKNLSDANRNYLLRIYNASLL